MLETYKTALKEGERTKVYRSKTVHIYMSIRNTRRKRKGSGVPEQLQIEQLYFFEISRLLQYIFPPDPLVSTLESLPAPSSKLEGRTHNSEGHSEGHKEGHTAKGHNERHTTSHYFYCRILLVPLAYIKYIQ